LSIAKTEAAIDALVDEHDPGALRRSRHTRCGRDVSFGAPPEPRYRPSAALVQFVRCRDLTCRWSGCDTPAYHCDLDHTVPYTLGPTHASKVRFLVHAAAPNTTVAHARMENIYGLEARSAKRYARDAIAAQ
jgi:hypothetical protein